MGLEHHTVTHSRKAESRDIYHAFASIILAYNDDVLVYFLLKYNYSRVVNTTAWPDIIIKIS